MKKRSALTVGMTVVLALSLTSGSAWAGKQGSCDSSGGDGLCQFEEDCLDPENGSAGGPGSACEYDTPGYGSEVMQCLFDHYMSQGWNGEGVNFEVQGNAPFIQIYGPNQEEPPSLCYRENNRVTAHTWVEVNRPNLIGKIRKATQRPSGLAENSSDPSPVVKITINDDSPIIVQTTGLRSTAALNQAIHSALLVRLGRENVDQSTTFFIILGDSQGDSPRHLEHYSSDTGYTSSEIEVGPNTNWGQTNCNPFIQLN